VSVFALAGGIIVYVMATRIHRQEFEREFVETQMLWATRVQANVERWVHRNDLEMVETIFGELGLFPEVRAALYVDARDVVLAATRRDLLHRPLDLGRLTGLGNDVARIKILLETTRRTLVAANLLTHDQTTLVVCLPTSLPIERDRLEVRRGGLILVVYDLRPAQVVRLARLQRDFLIYLLNMVLVAGTLGIALHFLITRRLERLESAMEAFAAGKAVKPLSDQFGDEISHLIVRFSEMAATTRNAIDEMQDLYNRAPCGYQSLDPDGTFVRINDTELSWLGYSRDEVVGRMNFSSILTPPSLEFFRTQFGRFKESGVLRDAEFELIRKDGSTFPVMISATAIKDERGTFLKSRSIVYDVTALKRAQAEIKLLNADLERRVRTRTQQLEEANRELAGFSYSMSHDLRAPLRSINGFSYALQRDYADNLDAKGIENLDRVRVATQKMGQLIDDMVRLIHISRVEMSWTDVDLGRIAEQVIDEHRARDPDRRVEFTAAPLCVVRGDAGLLRILLENALGNAWKYSAMRLFAKIEFGRTGTTDNPVFFVRDNGCGLDMQYAEKLFDAFQRLHGGKEFPGTGIGLACVRRVAQRHGGRAWIDGAVDKGATLYFNLPQAPVAPASGALSRDHAV
jgi:PAS domain S-box-containing protein